MSFFGKTGRATPHRPTGLRWCAVALAFGVMGPNSSRGPKYNKYGKSKSCWDSSGVNFKMLFDLILELQFAVTSVLQPSMAVEPDKNHESREELGRPGNLVKS